MKRKFLLLIKLFNFNYSSYAASISYFTILSIFPFCILMLTFLSIFLKKENIDSALIILSKYITSYGIELLRKEILNIFNAYKTHLNILSLLALIWSATNLYSSIEAGLNAVYEIKEGRSFFHSKLISLLILIIFIPSLLFIAQLHLFYKKLWEHFGVSNHLLLIFIRISIIFISLFLLHILAYVFLPFKKIPLKSTLEGSLFSTSCWIILSISFDWYIKNFSSYNKIYGSIATIVIFLIYIYMIATFFLIGARINYFKSLDKCYFEN